MKLKHLELILAAISVFRGVMEVIEDMIEGKVEVENEKAAE